VPILSGVGPGLGQVKVLLAFQRLGCGTMLMITCLQIAVIS